MTFVGPTLDPDAWSKPVITGKRWRGDCRVDGCDRANDWEKKKGKGTDGATTTYQGADLAEPKITFIMWRGFDGLEFVDYFTEWAEYKKLFEMPAGTKDPVALVIEHPQFALAKIKGCVVKKVGDLKVFPGGRGECTVEFLEFRKPKKALGTPKGASGKGGGSGGGGANGDRPKSAIELEIEKTNAESAKLLEELKK